RCSSCFFLYFFFFQAEDGIRDLIVTGVQTCALPISSYPHRQLTSGASPEKVCRLGADFPVSTEGLLCSSASDAPLYFSLSSLSQAQARIARLSSRLRASVHGRASSATRTATSSPTPTQRSPGGS